MLRLTLNNSSKTQYSFKPQFAGVSPYKFKKDVWDFGDKICIGNRTTNEVKLWEAIERNAIEININGTTNEVYIDILNSINETGFGPCEKKTVDCVRYDTEHIALEIDDVSETLLISLKNPEATNEIYNNLEYLLKDDNISSSKYDWIGTEVSSDRPLFISKRTNDKKKKELLAKTPRISLTAVATNNRKRA